MTLATIKIHIKGMHCANCESALLSEFKKAGVNNAKINRKADSAELQISEKDFDFKALKEACEKAGYKISLSEFSNREIYWQEMLKAALIVVVLLVAYKIFQAAGVLDKINFDAARINLGISFLIGLTASVSTCLAVVGAVVIAFAEKYQTGGRDFFVSAVKPNLFFHLGRFSSFFILGGFLGFVGGQLNISGNLIAIYTMIIGLVLLWLGLNILGFIPSLSDFVKIPSWFARKWKILEKSEHRAAPLLLGTFSFFLPCGFTQSMQIFALASGSFLSGGLNLLAFAVGTAPVLFGLGLAASWTRIKKITTLQKTAGLLIIIFSLFTLKSGLALKGIDVDVIGWIKQASQRAKDSAANKDSSKDVQIIKTSITAWGFEPNTFSIKAGLSVKFIIQGDNTTGCTNKIIIPSLGISKNIGRGENIIEFTPLKTGTIPFSCWMGMVNGKFIVEK